MGQDMVSFFLSCFKDFTFFGFGLAVIFGVIWAFAFWPPLKNPWVWAILFGSAVITWIAMSFVQIPLQYWTGKLLNQWFSEQILLRWLVIAGIPVILISGLVQEGAKLAPVVAYWWRTGKDIKPKIALAIGATSGVGFGILEAQWIHNTILASGWNWEIVQSEGALVLAGFWERLFVVGFHASACGLASYGLAKGKGWQFYLLVALLHTILNYSAILYQTKVFDILQVEIFVTILTILTAGAALWLRWKPDREEPKLKTKKARKA